MLLPSELWDHILVNAGPLALATEKTFVAAIRIQRGWRATSERICRSPWATCEVKFRFKTMCVPFHGVDPQASTVWKRGRLVRVSLEGEWAIDDGGKRFIFLSDNVQLRYQK